MLRSLNGYGRIAGCWLVAVLARPGWRCQRASRFVVVADRAVKAIGFRHQSACRCLSVRVLWCAVCRNYGMILVS